MNTDRTPQYINLDKRNHVVKPLLDLIRTFTLFSTNDKGKTIKLENIATIKSVTLSRTSRYQPAEDPLVCLTYPESRKTTNAHIGVTPNLVKKQISSNISGQKVETERDTLIKFK